MEIPKTVRDGMVLALYGKPLSEFDPKQGKDVGRTLIVVDKDIKNRNELLSVLEKEGYMVLALQSVRGLQQVLSDSTACALILEIDGIPMDNRALKELRRDNRELCIIVLSGRSFHPELKEALSRHIDACFSKPVEWDDLLYYLRGTLSNSAKRPPPSGKTETV